MGIVDGYRHLNIGYTILLCLFFVNGCVPISETYFRPVSTQGRVINWAGIPKEIGFDFNDGLVIEMILNKDHSSREDQLKILLTITPGILPVGVELNSIAMRCDSGVDLFPNKLSQLPYIYGSSGRMTDMKEITGDGVVATKGITVVYFLTYKLPAKTELDSIKSCTVPSFNITQGERTIAVPAVLFEKDRSTLLRSIN